MATAPMPTDEFDVSEDEGAMPDSELLAILGAHEANAIGYFGGDNDITAEQERGLEYYNGRMDDVPAQEGNSSVVDGTVALVIDNALASVLKPFVSSDETVRFSPRGPEDVEVAEQATEYVNYVFNVDNRGFLILHDWFKDAFLSKVGVVKAWWEEAPRMETEEVIITDELQAQFIRSQPNYLGEENGVATLGQEVPDGRVRVQNIPPEEFRISPSARSVDDALYTAHVPSNVTRSDLITMGFDAELIEELPAWSGGESENSVRDARYDDENLIDSRLDSPHKPNDRMAVRDEYVRIDYDGDGIAELRRIIRVDDVILHNEETDDNPFATLCPIPMPHKVYGHSLADRSLQEQRIGTVIWRQSLDNLYKSNNPRPIVGEQAMRSDGSTAESLMDNAPGAAILVKDLNSFTFGAVPFTAGNTLPMLELLDKKVEENTGISRAGQGLDTNALRKSGQMTATEMSLIASGKNARTEMVARIFAETGVSRLFKIILALVTKHQPRERVIRLRNKWVEIDPRRWPELDVEISVGLGIGDKSEQLAQSQFVLDTMERLAGSPFASMVGPKEVHAAVKRAFTAAGIKNTDEFLVEPQDDGQQEQPPSPEQQQMQAEMQMQQAKLQGEQQLAQTRLQLQAAEAAQKQQLAREQAEFDAQLARDKAQFEADLARDKAQFEAELASQKLAMEQQLSERKMRMTEREGESRISKNRPGGDLDK